MAAVMIGENYVSPFYQTIDCLKNPQMRWPHRNTRDCRRIAVMLIERGATIIGGNEVDEVVSRLTGEEWEKAVSLMLAIAARNGRWDDVIARLMETTGPIWNGCDQTEPNQDADFQPYVVNAARCGPQHMVAKDDHYTFCERTADRS